MGKAKDPCKTVYKETLKRLKGKYLVTGKFMTVCNGISSYVIVSLVCQTKEEAETVKADRDFRYKDLQIEEL